VINKQIINPGSIVVVGGSNNINKPGGKVLKNIIEGNFKGNLYVVNPKEDKVQGVKCFRDIKNIPNTDLAIIAVPAKHCLQTVEVLAKEKGTLGYIILSSGFGEVNDLGKSLESNLTRLVNDVRGCLIGPNCIGILNSNYKGVFTSPIPKLDPKG